MWECIIISKPNSYSIWMFFVSPESVNLYLPVPCFNVQMWPVLALQLHFENLMFHSAGDGGVYHYFKIPILTQIRCSFFPLKAMIYTFQNRISMHKCGQHWCHNFIWYEHNLAHQSMTHVHCGKSHFHSGRASSIDICQVMLVRVYRPSCLPPPTWKSLSLLIG